MNDTRSRLVVGLMIAGLAGFMYAVRGMIDPRGWRIIGIFTLGLIGFIGLMVILATRSAKKTRGVPPRPTPRVDNPNQRPAAVTQQRPAAATTRIPTETETVDQLLARARALARNGDHRGALTSVEAASRLRPDDASILFFRGLTHAKLDDLDAALADVRRAVALDPSIPDGQKVLQSLEEIAARVAPLITGTHYCFICTGNPSVIASMHDIFRSNVPDVEVSRFRAMVDALRAKRDEASSQGLAFKGKKFFGANEESVEAMEDVLAQMVAASTREVHMLYVVALGDMYLRTQLLFKDIASQAIQQGILPFPMFATEEAEAKQFLVEAFDSAGRA